MRLQRGYSVVGLVVALLLGLLLAPATTSAADAGSVQFGAGSATPTYGEGIVFSQAVDIREAPARFELELSFPRQPGAIVIEVDEPATTGSTTLTHTYDVTADGHILPNTEITARWVAIGDGQARIAVSDPVRMVYRDTRFDWRTREGDIVRVHWYEGSDEFGQRALDIGESAVQETAELLGVTESEPIDFFIYADEDSFRVALGPGTRENVGGQANAEIRTLFALIRPEEIDQPWVGIVIPHELVHLVFDTTVKNPYHFPPRWLNEGLAVYLSQSYDESDRAAVEAAALDGSLIPLDGLTGQFPTTFERFSLAYAESVSAVDYLVRTHGPDALFSLIRSYSAGRTDDAAFEQAIGVDVEAFDAAWRDDLGAAVPVVHGPQPAPPGPIPPGWSGSGEPTPASPGATGEPPAAPQTPTRPADPQGGVDAVLVAGAGLALLIGVVVLIRVRMRRGQGAP